MLKKELIKKVAAESGHTEKTVREVIESILTVVLTALAGGASVMLLGLGKLGITHRGEKVARNLHTGAKVVVPPRTVATFRPSDAVVDALNPPASA